MAGGRGGTGKTGHTRGGGSDLLWVVPFALLVIAGVVVAALASGSDRPPLPTFSPEPTRPY